MTLAPSANSNVELLTGELKQFNSEDELYGYLDQLSHDVDGVSFLDKAKAAVNAWWVRAIIGVANADSYYGFDTEGGSLGKNGDMPLKLVAWLHSVGLDNKDKIHKARSAARVWLSLDTPNCQELIEDVGITKLMAVGRAPIGKRAEFLDQARQVATAELARSISGYNSSKEGIEARLDEFRNELQRRKKLLEAVPAGTRNQKANKEYKKLKDSVDSAIESVRALEAKLEAASVPEDADRFPRQDVTEVRVETYQKEAADAKAKAEALEAELKALKENTPKQVVKEVVKTVVDTSAHDEVMAQYEALLKQNSQLSVEMRKLQEAKDNWEKMCRAADKKVERMSGATREWENWSWERRMDLINVYITRFAESAGMFNFCQGDVDDSARRALVSPEARFKSHEERAIQAISMWIDVLSTEGVQELRNALENRGDLPPVDYVDSRELVTIDV